MRFPDRVNSPPSIEKRKNSMLVSSRNHWIRNLLSRWGWMSPQRTRSRRRVLRGGHFQGPTAALVETLESRQLLSGTPSVDIRVDSAASGTNYPADVTVSDLNKAAFKDVTLRDAVNAANNTPGGDVIAFTQISFPANSQHTITVKGGPLELTDQVTIIGPDGAQVTVDGGNATTVFKVDAGVLAEIDGLTIAHGLATVTDSQNKTAGGAIYNAGNLTLNNDVITASVADSGGSGGGIYNASGGNLTVQQSTVSDNKAPTGSGGGIYNDHGMLTLHDDVIGHNTAANGGGISTQAGLTLVNSTIADNSATGESGRHGGGIDSEGGDLIVVNSTIDHNSASGSSSHGGGIQFSGTKLNVVNSTIANNSAGTGGGIAVGGGNATVSNSTLARNSADHSSGGVDNGATSFTLSASIVAGNVGGIPKVADDWGGQAASSASSYNLIGAAGDSGLTNGNGNRVGTDASPIYPFLADLADNGGPTRTMALLVGSPALGFGGTTLPTDPVTGVPLVTDQRGTGFSRSSGTGIDIGAFEAQGIHAISAPDVTYGAHGQVHVTLDPSSGSGTLLLYLGSGTFTKSVAAGDTDVSFDVGLVNAGAYSVIAVFTPTNDVTPESTQTGLLFVNRADATIKVTGDTVTYDGQSHTAKGTATGVNGESLAGLQLTAHTSAGTYSDTWTFTDTTGNYNYSTGVVDGPLVINKADVTFNVSPYNVTYDGNAHTATGTVSGVNGETPTGLDLTGTSHTGAGSYSDTVLFTDSTGNYNNSQVTVTDSIARADATIQVNGYVGVYDGASHGATGTATGVDGGELSGLDLGAKFTNAPGGIAHWTFSGNANYNQASGDVSIAIGARSLDAVLSTAGSINIAKNGTINFVFSNVSGALGGETLTQLFNGAQFSLTIGSAVYTGTSTVVVNNGTVTVSWQMNQQLYTDFASLLNGATGKVPESLTVSGTSVDGNYALSEDVLTTLFQ
jgi:hypothetical protein